MKLVVLGATGSTGLEIVRQAMQRSHSVTAFVRSPERLKPLSDRIIIKQEICWTLPSLNTLFKVMMQFCQRSGRACPYRKRMQTFYGNSLSR